MLENNNTGHEPEYLVMFMACIIAMFGGICKELSNFESCFNVRRFFSNVLISGFCGLLVGLAAPEFEHKNLVMIAAGISGTMGISLVNYIADISRVVIKHLASQTIGKEISYEDIKKVRTHKTKNK